MNFDKEFILILWLLFKKWEIKKLKILKKFQIKNWERNKNLFFLKKIKKFLKKTLKKIGTERNLKKVWITQKFKKVKKIKKTEDTRK